MTYIDNKENHGNSIEMAKLTKISSDEVQRCFNAMYGVQENRLTKSNVKQEKIENSSLKIDLIVEEDETSIYEYDYECIKKSGLLDQIQKRT